MSASSPSRTANLWETPQEYFIFLLRITAKRNWSPTVFPFLPPRETKGSPDPTPVRILTRSKMQNAPMGVCISDAPNLGQCSTMLDRGIKPHAAMRQERECPNSATSEPLQRGRQDHPLLPQSMSRYESSALIFLKRRMSLSVFRLGH